MMNPNRRVTLFHNPQSRSAGVRILLEELKADYTLHLLDFKKGQQRAPEYLCINPMGKVPAILHGDALVTEQVAIYIYLADLYAEAGLAPGLQDPLRGPYLRWIAFYGSCFEPAMVDKALKRDAAPPSMCPYGDFDTVVKTLSDQLAQGSYLLGERFSAADVLWGASLNWMVTFKMLPETPVIRAYIDTVTNRDGAKRAAAADTELTKEVAV